MLPQKIKDASRRTMQKVRNVYGAYNEVRENPEGHSIFRYSKRQINPYVIAAYFRQELGKELNLYGPRS